MPSLDALGQLEAVGDRWRIRFTRHLPHPIEKVWRAVTEPEHLVAWFPTTIDGERAAGADLTFRFPHDGAPEMKGTMLAWEPPRLMEIRWGDDDVLRIELAAVDGGTRLTLTDVFGEQGKAARDGAGWHASLDHLVDHLAGRPTSLDDDGRWAELAPAYREAFGPAASTIGPPDWHPEG
jgi:uncharacterized protein YndB with AHSA1/START domain